MHITDRARTPMAWVLAGICLVASAFAAPVASDVVPDRAGWAMKVSPSLLRPEMGGQTLKVLVAFSEPSPLLASSTASLAAPSRLRWIAGRADDLAQRHGPAGLQVVQRYSHLPIVAVQLPAALLAELATDPTVAAVSPDRTAHVFSRAAGKQLMDVSAIEPPYTGTGVGIAVVDTGVDFSHPELAPLGTKSIALYDATRPVGAQDYATDDYGHGTSVAGVAAGLAVAGSVGGVAPGATVVSVKVLGSNGSGSSSQIIGGLNAILASVTSGNPYNIRIANLSFGGYDPVDWPPGNGVCDTLDPPMTTAFDALTAAGVLVVVAAGNGACTIGVAWPACIGSALAMGAVYDGCELPPGCSVNYSSPQQCTGTGCFDSGTAPDKVACYSDSGSRLDAWAPGTCPEAPTPGGGYEECFAGTSPAAAYASGLAALLAQALPSATTGTLRSALRDVGQPVTDPRNGVTRNRVGASLALARLFCAAPGAPGDLAVGPTTLCAGQGATLSWSVASGAASYAVQAAHEPTFTAPVTFQTQSSPFVYTPSGAAPETVYLRVRAVAACGTPSAWVGPVVVNSSGTCLPLETWVAGIAHTSGVPPAFWVTDLTVLNPTSSDATARLSFFGTASPPPIVTHIPAGKQAMWGDVLPALFGVSASDKGAILIESDQTLAAQARTYSRLDDAGQVRTFGQTYPGVTAKAALPPGTPGFLPGLRSDGGFRTNLELLNVGDADEDVELRFLDADGMTITTAIVTVPTRRWVQLVRALPEGYASAYAEVRANDPGGRIVAFASVIDGNSTDPSTVQLWTP